MSLILCRPESVRQPLYMDALGVHLYSSQELCYVIVNHPFLVMDGFFSDTVIDFIKKELEMPYLAAKIGTYLEEEKTDEALICILQECGCTPKEEINRFQHKLETLRKMSPADYAKEKADYYCKNRKYGRAISLYEQILAMPKETRGDDWFIGKVWNNLAAAYVNMFYFDKAMTAYERACDRTGSEKVLKQMYFLKKLCPNLEMRERYLGAVTDDNRKEWDQEYDQAASKASELEEIRNIERTAELPAEEGRQTLIRQTAAWKREYREMA